MSAMHYAVSTTSAAACYWFSNLKLSRLVVDFLSTFFLFVFFSQTKCFCIHCLRLACINGLIAMLFNVLALMAIWLECCMSLNGTEHFHPSFPTSTYSVSLEFKKQCCNTAQKSKLTSLFLAAQINLRHSA